MALVPHKITALAESDAQGTDGKNIVAGAVVSLYNTNGTAVTLFDDENGTNGSTAKQTDATGQVVVYVDEGEYDEEVNGSIRRRVLIGSRKDNIASYATTAELEATRPNKTGQRAENRERANAQYTLAAEGYTAQPGDIVAANGRVWELQIDEAVNARVFGLFGGGDETVKLQEIADRMDETKEVFFTDDFSLTSTVTFSNGGRLDFGNITVDCTGIPAGVTGNDAYGLIFKGEIGNEVINASTILKGQDSFTGGESINFSNGDLVLIKSDETFIDGHSNPFSKRGEVLRVKPVFSKTFQTFGGTYFDYNFASNITFQKITPTKVQVTGGNFLFAGDASVISGIKIENAYNPIIENVSITGAEDCGIQTYNTLGGRISRCTFTDITSPGEGSSGVSFNSGYGVVAYGGTRGLRICNNIFNNCRRAITGGGALPAIFITTDHNESYGGFNGFGNHEPCLEWNIHNNTIVSPSSRGLTIRGQNTRANFNKMYNCGSAGVQVRNFVNGSFGVSGVELIGNEIDGAGNNGIWLEGTPEDGRVKDVLISGGYIKNTAFNSIFGEMCDEVVVRDVIFGKIKSGTEGVTDGNAVYFRGSTALDDQCTNITVDDITIEETTLRHGISFRYSVDVSATNIKMLNPSPNHGINGLSCEGISIEGGRIKAPSTATSFLYPVYLQDCNNVKVDGACLYGFAGTANIHGVRIQSSTSSEDHVITGCSMFDCDRAVSIVSAGTNHSVVTGNNGRNCTNAQKFDVDSANQVVANNLS